MKKILSIFIVSLVMLTCAISVKAEDNTACSYEELKSILENAPDDGSETAVILSGKLTMNPGNKETLTVKQGQNVVLKDDGNIAQIEIEGFQSMRIFEISEGAKLTLDKTDSGFIEISGESYTDRQYSNRDSGTFLVKGEMVMNYADIHDLSTNSFDSGIITVYGGNFTMNSGSIHDNDLTSQMEGVVYLTHGGSFVMNGGDILNNYLKPEALYNAAVTVEPKYGESLFVMNDGRIDSNTAFSGAVLVGSMSTELFSYDYMNDMATMVMNGGTISNNISTHAGGGVSVLGRGRFEMYDGLIDSNSANMGGGVGIFDYWKIYFEPYYPNMTVSQYEAAYNIPSEFIMYGGSITNNRAINRNGNPNDTSGGCGGGVYAASNSVKLVNGLISSNSANRQGGGVYCASRPYEMLIENAVVTRNSANEVGGGIWACPTGKVELLELSGNRVYGNVSLDGEDVFLEATVEGLKEVKEKREKENLTVSNAFNLVLIEGNTAPKGGGIGTNGKVTVVGYTPLETTTLAPKTTLIEEKPEKEKEPEKVSEAVPVYQVVNTSTR